MWVATVRKRRTSIRPESLKGAIQTAGRHHTWDDRISANSKLRDVCVGQAARLIPPKREKTLVSIHAMHVSTGGWMESLDSGDSLETLAEIYFGSRASFILEVYHLEV